MEKLPLGLRFLSSSDAVIQDGRKLVWRLGKVPMDATDTVRLVTRASPSAPVGKVLLTQAQFSGAMTFSPPAAAVAVVGP